MFAYHPEKPARESAELGDFNAIMDDACDETIAEVEKPASHEEPIGDAATLIDLQSPEQESKRVNGMPTPDQGSAPVDDSSQLPQMPTLQPNIDQTTPEDAEQKTQEKAKKTVKILSDEEVKEHRQKMLYKINSYCIPCIKNKYSNVADSLEVMEIFATDMVFREALLFIRNSYTTALRHQHIELRNALRNDIAQTLIDGDVMPVYKKILDMFFKLDFVNEEGKLVKKYFNPVSHVMIALFNFTDKSEPFTKSICNTPGLLEIIVWFLRDKREAHLKGELDKQVDKMVKASLSTLYNCSRLNENRARLLEVGSFEVALPYLDSSNSSFQMSALFCIAYLSDEEKSHVFAARKHLLERLLKNLATALKRDDRQCLGWSAYELIKGIDVLSRNDANKRLVVECGAFDVLLQAMRREDLPMEQLESTKTIWTLCFDKDNKAALVEDTESMDWFDAVAADPDHQCRKMAKGILWTVTKLSAYEPGNTIAFDGLVANRRPGSADLNDVPHVMISYQWDVQPLMIKIKDILKGHGYKVWMDIESMQGSTLSAMADAIEQSCVVIVAMSQRYKNSQNCRVEGEYAFTKGKKIVPLIVEPKFKPDGWLGLILGAKLYYNFCGRDPFEAVMENLIRGLGNQGKQIVDRRLSVSMTPESSMRVAKEYAAPPPQLAPPKPAKEEARPKPEVTEWDSAKVEEWMDHNSISRTQVGNLTGRHLMFLQEMKQTAPDFYYKYVRRLFTGKLPIEELDALSSFSAALEKL